MKATFTIDDQLFEEAMELTNIRDSELLIKIALERMLIYESAKRLVELGGTEREFRLNPNCPFEQEN